MAEVDPLRFTQVIDNLLTNAIKYGPENSEIQTEIIGFPDHFEVRVADQGPGIPDGDLDNLFNAFAVTSNKTTGGESSHGLGLHIVKKILDGHNGNIHYESNIPSGSIFVVNIPK